MFPSEPQVKCFVPAKAGKMLSWNSQGLERSSHQLQLLKRKHSTADQRIARRRLWCGTGCRIEVVGRNKTLQSRRAHGAHNRPELGAGNNISGAAIPVPVSHQDFRSAGILLEPKGDGQRTCKMAEQTQ